MVITSDEISTNYFPSAYYLSILFHLNIDPFYMAIVILGGKLNHLSQSTNGRHPSFVENRHQGNVRGGQYSSEQFPARPHAGAAIVKVEGHEAIRKASVGNGMGGEQPFTKEDISFRKVFVTIENREQICVMLLHPMTKFLKLFMGRRIDSVRSVLHNNLTIGGQ